MLELGTEPCTGWGILNHFLAGGGQMSLGLMAYLTFFFFWLMLVLGLFGFVFIFSFEVNEE